MPAGSYGRTLQYFENFTEHAVSYKVHNAALKFIRDCCEAHDQNPARMIEYGLHPDFQEKLVVPVVKHAHKSPDYEFDWDNVRKWHWHQMVAMLNPESMRYVVEGDQQNGARSRGLVSCELVQMDRYDHKRHHKDPSMEGDLKVWDFVLFRNDGSCIALHPEYRSKTFACTRGMPVTDLEIPKHGRGGSDGAGTFKYFKNRQADKQLRFAASKEACAPAPQSRPAPPPATTMPGPPAPPPPAQPAVADKQHSLATHAMALRDKYRRVEYDKTKIGLSTVGTHPKNRNGLYPCGHRCKALAVDVVGKVGFLKECVEHSAVAVEEPPASFIKQRGADYVSGSEYNIKSCSKDPLLKNLFAVPHDDVRSLLLSHNHIMLVMRAFMVAAHWDIPVNTEKNLRMCDEKGNLSLTAIAAHNNGKELVAMVADGIECEQLA